MTKIEVKFVMDNNALDGLLRGPNGAVYVDMLRRCEILQNAARMQIPYGFGDSGPSGHLKDSIVKRIYGSPSGEELVAVWVGSEHPRAMLHHEGTQPHTIEATNNKPMVFEIDGIKVFAMTVNHPGTQPNRYLTDNLPLIAQDSGE